MHPLHKQRIHGLAYPHEELGVHVRLLKQGLEKHDVSARMLGKPCHIMAFFLQQLSQKLASVEF